MVAVILVLAVVAGLVIWLWRAGRRRDARHHAEGLREVELRQAHSAQYPFVDSQPPHPDLERRCDDFERLFQARPNPQQRGVLNHQLWHGMESSATTLIWARNQIWPKQ